jgi:uncharacterized membrane protein YiaA
VADYPAVAGLVLDIGGAVLLARGITFGSARAYLGRQYAETVMAAMEGVDLQRDQERARDVADAATGVGLLVAGFVLQAVGAWQSQWSNRWAGLFFPAACVIGGVAAVYHSARVSQELEAIYVERMSVATKGHPSLVFLVYLDLVKAGAVSARRLVKWTHDASERRDDELWTPETRAAMAKRLDDVCSVSGCAPPMLSLP